MLSLFIQTPVLVYFLVLQRFTEQIWAYELAVNALYGVVLAVELMLTYRAAQRIVDVQQRSYMQAVHLHLQQIDLQTDSDNYPYM